MMKELSKPDWVLLSQVAYLVLTLLVCLRIVYDTRNTTKALAYILLTIFLPGGGGAGLFLLRHQLPPAELVQQRS
jgi:cardiolipin synthase